MSGSKRTSLALTVLLLALLAACGAPAAPTSAPPAATNPPVAPTTQPPAAATSAPAAATSAPTVAAPTAAASGAANTLVLVKNTNDIVTFDPAEAYEFSDWLGVHVMYDTLVKFEGADLATPKPGLATKWDIKDAGDHWEVTFTLRGDAKTPAGNTLTADDVVYSFQRGIKLNKAPAFLWTDIGGLKDTSIKATAPNTVVLSMPKTASPLEFLNVLTAPPMSIVDSKEVKAHEAAGDLGNTWLKDHSAGSGPYLLDHWTKSSEFLLKANPNASLKPKTPNILVKEVTDSTSQQAQVDKGDADIAFDLTPEQIKAFQGRAGITTLKGGNLQIFYIGMNVNVKPLDNNSVREALRTAIDYDGIANDLLSGNAQRLNAVVPIGLFGANTDKIFQKDVNKAKQLLKDGGVPNGFEIEMRVIGGQKGIVPMSDLAAKIQADWAEIGVKVSPKLQPDAELLPDYRAAKVPIFMGLWGPDFPDPDANGTPFADAPLAKRNNYDDAKAKDLAKKAQLETDPDKRKAAYKDLTEYLAHNGPYAILFQPSQLFAYRSNVKDFVWNAGGVSDLWTISK